MTVSGSSENLHVAIALMMGRPAGMRKARTALSVADKKKVLDELKAGKPAVDVAAEFQISQRPTFVSIVTQLLNVSQGVIYRFTPKSLRIKLSTLT